MDYEKYRLEWMLSHGHTLPELIEKLGELMDECPGMTLVEVAEEWEKNVGFEGEIWACHAEWEDEQLNEKLHDLQARLNRSKDDAEVLKMNLKYEEELQKLFEKKIEELKG